MSDPRFIGEFADLTPGEVRTTSARPRRMADDLLREASQRLGVVALTAGALWFLSPGIEHFIMWAAGNPQGASFTFGDGVALCAIAASVALYLFTRFHESNPRFILDLGLVYMILQCFALGVIMHWDPMPMHIPIFPMLSWAGVIVIMFAATIPSSPGKMLAASLIAVSMNPIGMLIARARGTWDFEPTSQVIVMHYPDYLLAGAALIISRVVTKLGMQVTRARELGSYVVGELLGSGGMGAVYRATHRMLARPAAIKLIRPELLGMADGAAAQLAIKRFRREAETAASLRSPHTVELYDFGVTEQQTFYFVMELLEGYNLEALVQKTGPVPAARAVYLLRQVCESLAEAHARGMVHRDVKPANIHVGRLGLQHDFVKVLDFGLVKCLADVGDMRSLATAEGLTPGTPAYMAPEVARNEPVDARADVYAVGCVAYYLLTGRLVFEGATGLQMILMHASDTPVPPSRRAELPVPPALDELVLACLAKAPAGRPQSAIELMRRLDAVPVEPWNEEQAERWWGLHQPA